MDGYYIIELPVPVLKSNKANHHSEYQGLYRKNFLECERLYNAHYDKCKQQGFICNKCIKKRECNKIWDVTISKPTGDDLTEREVELVKEKLSMLREIRI